MDNSARADSKAITCLAVDPESNPRRRAEPTAAAFGPLNSAFEGLQCLGGRRIE